MDLKQKLLELSREATGDDDPADTEHETAVIADRFREASEVQP